MSDYLYPNRKGNKMPETTTATVHQAKINRHRRHFHRWWIPLMSCALGTTEWISNMYNSMSEQPGQQHTQVA